MHLYVSCASVLQEEKQQQKIAFERHLEEKQKEHTQLFLMNTSHKESMLNSVRQVQLHCVCVCEREWEMYLWTFTPAGKLKILQQVH